MARAGTLVTRKVPHKESLHWLSTRASSRTICTELSSWPLAMARALAFRPLIPQETQTGLAKAQVRPAAAQTGPTKAQAGPIKTQTASAQAKTLAAEAQARLTTGPTRQNNWAFTLPKVLHGKLMWPKYALKRQKTFASTLRLFNTTIIQLNQSSK